MSKAMQENIKRQLQAKNMTAAELERRTGIPHAVVNILHGRSKNPSIKTAQAIAKELGCSVEELLADETNALPQTNIPITNNHVWDSDLYSQAFQVVNQHVIKAKLNTTPEQMGQWLTDVYTYALGSKERVVDP